MAVNMGRRGRMGRDITGGGSFLKDCGLIGPTDCQPMVKSPTPSLQPAMLLLLRKSVPLRFFSRRPLNPFFLPPPSRPRRLPLLPRAAMGSVAGDAARLAYPTARRDDSVVDDYHGVQIPDPYRWLEDPDSEETKEFVAKQAELAETVLAGCLDRENLRREVTRLFDHPRHGAPFRRGNKYFHFHNSGLQAQSVLYMQDHLDGEAEVLVDPNTLSKDGTIALSTYSISEDGKYIAYGLSESGSDWVSIHVMSVADKQPMRSWDNEE